MADTTESERKSRSLKIRLAPSTYARLEALAARAGVTLGDWVSAAIRAERMPDLERRDVRSALAKARRRAAGVHGT